MTIELASLEDIKALLGRPPTTSGTIRVDQTMIDAFAQVTRDRQWIHVDPARAALESPYGGTIAHGFLTLSLLSHLFGQTYSFPGARLSLNYGFDRVRFTGAVAAGAEICATIALHGAVDVAPREVRAAWDVAVRVTGAQRPALVARWLTQVRY